MMGERGEPMATPSICSAEKKGIVYVISCQDYTQAGRILKKCMAEHKQAVKRFDENGVAVHVFKHDLRRIQSLQ